MEIQCTLQATNQEVRENLISGIQIKDANGKWGEPVNCGNVINTPYNEDTPFFDPMLPVLCSSVQSDISAWGDMMYSDQ